MSDKSDSVDNAPELQLLDKDGNEIKLTKCLIFPELWESILKSSSDEEIISDFKDVQSTLGIVGALLLAIIYGRVGRTEDVHPNSVWGSHIDIGEILLTLINHINIFLCLYTTITSARTYILLSCFPNEKGRSTIAKFGPRFIIDIPYILMPPITALFILDTVIRSSLTLPRTVGIITLCLSFVASVVATYSWTVLDDWAEEAMFAMVHVRRKIRKPSNQRISPTAN